MFLIPGHCQALCGAQEQGVEYTDLVPHQGGGDTQGRPVPRPCWGRGQHVWLPWAGGKSVLDGGRQDLADTAQHGEVHGSEGARGGHGGVQGQLCEAEVEVLTC